MENIKMLLNDELNGIELYWPEGEKPDKSLREVLKFNGFRFSWKKECWYAKKTDARMNFVNELLNNTQEIINQETALTQTQNNNTYFPSYTHVNGTEIFKSSDIELNSNISGYYADINAYVHFYRDSVVLVDLTNALKTGKTCKRYSFRLNIYDDSKSVLTELWNIAKIETLKAFHNAVITESLSSIKTLDIYTSEEKSIKTFSPFVEIKSIKTPKKWTIAHVWKAIFSGQIYKGVKDGHYTDDYAYDAGCNYGTGSRLHLVSLAEKLIEHSSGWWVSVDKEENGIIQLSVNCHSFDCNTLYFDEKCNMQEADSRRIKENQELENYNNSLLAQMQDIKPEDIEENTLYTVTYLVMDDNTKRYNKKSELLTGSELFWEDTVYPVDKPEGKQVIESRYQITALEVYFITDDKLYTISNFYNRPDFNDDMRFINMGNWETILTGKALKEVLTQGNIYPMIQESQYNFETAITYIQNHMTGKMKWCYSVCDTDYQESFKRIMKEINRLNINSTAI